ncbi:hypothetical protein SDC9_198582 [bioreactor metagenome]|uniref:Uncharacterized protein n=1 Tax=bioreactor metagenome TaxID=1076179 RepID=A0A645IJB3_9ZZZZ
MSSRVFPTGKGRKEREKVPDSILEKSRRSLRTTRRCRALSWIIPARFRWDESRGVSRSSSDIPRTPFMGVRISWLMLATNSDLAALALSASSLAARIVSSAVFLSVMSSPTAWRNWIFPEGSKNALLIHRCHLREPSGENTRSSLEKDGSSGVREERVFSVSTLSSG